MLRSGNKAKDITPSIARRTEAWERGNFARRSSLKGREKAIVSQTNIGTVSKATLWKRLTDRTERIITGFSERL